MSLYNDLLEILTPFANAIKSKANSSSVYTKTEVDNAIANVTITTDSSLDSTSTNPIQNKPVADAISALNGSLETKILDLEKFVGAPITRKLLTSDLEVIAGDGAYAADSSGNLICTEDASTKNIAIRVNGIESLDFDFLPGVYNIAKPLLGYQGSSTTSFFMMAMASTGGKQVGVLGPFVGPISAGQTTGSLNPYRPGIYFDSGAQCAHMHIEITAGSYRYTVTDTLGREYSYDFPETIVTGDKFLGFGHITRVLGTTNPKAGEIIAKNVIVRVPGSGETVDVDSPIHGSKWVVFGDSISNSSQGYGHYMDYIASWCGLVTSPTYSSGATLQGDILNLAVSGYTSSSIVTRLNQIDNNAGESFTGVVEWIENASLITILIGVNDWLLPSPNTLATVKSNIQTWIDWCIGHNSDASIGIMCPLQCAQAPSEHTGASDCTAQNSLGLTLLDYVDAIKEVAEKNSIPCLDLYRNGSFPATNATFRQAGYFSGDYLHPSNKSHQRFGKIIQRWLENEVLTY